MKNILLSAGVALVLLSSCNVAYRTTSTPDDIYYSAPAVQPDQDDNYLAYHENSEDRYLEMKVRNRYQWNALDDFRYWNDSRYDFGYTCSPSRSVLMNPYNPYYGYGYGYSLGLGYYGFGIGYYNYPWNLWYSPYSTIVYYKNPKVYGQTSKSNLTGYRNANYNNTNSSSFGGLLKSAFSNNNSSSNNNNYNNNKSYTPSRSFSTTPSSNAGGRSGGYNSAGSSAGSGRNPR